MRARGVNKLRVETIARWGMEITQLPDYYGNFEVWKAKGKHETENGGRTGRGISVRKVAKETEE